MTASCVSIILPVYNEDGNIAACLRGLMRAMQGLDHEILVCYDFDEDKTLPAIAAMEDRPATVKTVRNTLGRGAAFAIRAGFQAARGDVLVTTMADLSDPPEVIPMMARKIRDEGADVVSGSRYMKGGSQTGGPPFKVLLSRAAGLSLRWIVGLGTHDATTNFRAYSRRFIDQVKVESQAGFELALELTVKAHAKGFAVAEVPSTWKDRSAGESRFRLWTWLPRYLRWYLHALAEPMAVWGILAAAAVAAFLLAVRNGPVVPFWPDEWMYLPVATGREPITLEWLFSFHNEHRIPLPKLVWAVVERMSGLDGRWGSALNAVILTCAAGVLVIGLRSMRGRMAWTDAAAPLLLLHGGHWENLTWPFQVAFCLFALLVAWILSRLMAMSRAPRDASDPSLAAALLLLPLCGASTLPFVALLAPWTIWISRKDPRPVRRRLSMGLAAGALLLIPLYFGFERQSHHPPSPGVLADARTGLELLTAGVGVAGTRNWPLSGWIAAALLGLSTLLLARARAVGILLVLGAFVGLALVVGHTRPGSHSVFIDRYVTLFALVPVTAYAALHFLGRPTAVRIGQAAILALAALLVQRNRDHAEDRLGERRIATEMLLRDVRAGVPSAILSRRHLYWWPVEEAQRTQGFEALARDRISVYRDAPPPAPFREGAKLDLADGRTLFDLSERAEVILEPKKREIVIDAGLLNASAEDLICTVRLLRDGASPQLLASKSMGRAGTGFARAVFMVPEGRLEVTVRPAWARASARPWMIAEFR